MKKRLLLSFIPLLFSLAAAAQPSLLDELNDSNEKKKPDYAFATFKGVRLINGHSVEMPAKGEMIFIIAHRFGTVENGAYDLFGLDQATMRFGFEYTLPTDFVCVGVGRNTFQKTYDGFIKAKLFRQSKGARNFPVTIDLVSTMALSALRWQVPDRENYFTSRLSYSHQLLIARKFNSRVSLQLMPTIVHRNLVPKKSDQNTLFAMGVGGRYKITNRVAICAEYYTMLPGQQVPLVGGFKARDCIAIGFDIETGGHVFQLQFTNAQAMYEPGFIAGTTDDFFNKGIHFGFNITRTFSFKKEP